MLVYSVVNCSVVSNSLQPVRLLCLWTSPGKNIGVGCHALLPEIFSTQGLNPGLPNCRRNLYCLSHQGSLRIYEPLEAGYTGETALIHRFFTFSSTVCVCVCVCARVCTQVPQLCVAPWTTARQAPLPKGLSRQECRSGLPFPSPGDLPDPGTKAGSLTCPAPAVGFFTSRDLT